MKMIFLRHIFLPFPHRIPSSNMLLQIHLRLLTLLLLSPTPYDGHFPPLRRAFFLPNPSINISSPHTYSRWQSCSSTLLSERLYSRLESFGSLFPLTVALSYFFHHARFYSLLSFVVYCPFCRDEPLPINSDCDWSCPSYTGYVTLRFLFDYAFLIYWIYYPHSFQSPSKLLR
jgi:hypothetical protein